MNTERRGRPKSSPTDPTELPRKFTREMAPDSDGVTALWKYDLDKTDRGPIEVELIYPKGFKSSQEKIDENNAKLPLKYREYINPSNGKIVGYARAKALGII
jgi:hypothetical protein